MLHSLEGIASVKRDVKNRADSKDEPRKMVFECVITSLLKIVELIKSESYLSRFDSKETQKSIGNSNVKRHKIQVVLQALRRAFNII